MDLLSAGQEGNQAVAAAQITAPYCHLIMGVARGTQTINALSISGLFGCYDVVANMWARPLVGLYLE